MAANSWAVEAKVVASTVAATVVGLTVTLLNEIPGNAALLGPLPGWLQGVLTMAAPPLATFLAGWAARHTPRPSDGP
jgi:hypothetical protein